jgi:MoxR-like ATPase
MTLELPSSVNQKQRILLRGFPAGEEPSIAAHLTASGYTMAQTLAGADLVVSGPDISERVLQLARERQIQVRPWAEIQQSLQASATPQRETIFERAPILERTGDHVSILGTSFPCTGTPDPELFTDLCFDEPFLRALRAAVRGAAHGFPSAFEGPTAASKTTVVLWLGRALGRPVSRLNLSGQTDCGELIGRFVPARQGDDWDVGSLSQSPEDLQPVTRTILERASGRGLTWAERVVVRRAERIESNQWRFQEGIIPQALRQGHFVLLDELNLAEPQILERLNPVLEQPTSLVLSEGDHTRWGRDGLPVHPWFRIFATLNPAEYSGRSVMSPAFRDRFVNWFQAHGPGEREYLAHLRFIVFGEQPEVHMEGRIYQAPSSKPRLPELAQTSGIEGLLGRLARFHALLSKATLDAGDGQPGLGRSRRERYVFSRRGLMACLQLWSAARTHHPTGCAVAQLGQAIGAIYFERLAAGDQKAARSIATAAGLPMEGPA